MWMPGARRVRAGQTYPLWRLVQHSRVWRFLCNTDVGNAAQGPGRCKRGSSLWLPCNRVGVQCFVFCVNCAFFEVYRSGEGEARFSGTELQGCPIAHPGQHTTTRGVSNPYSRRTMKFGACCPPQMMCQVQHRAISEHLQDPLLMEKQQRCSQSKTSVNNQTQTKRRCFVTPWHDQADHRSP